MSATFDQRHLIELGVSGFVPLRSLPRGSTSVPDVAGIYAVILEPPDTTFLPGSVGGRFKGKDPTVTNTALEANWIDDVSTVYLGRAKHLRRRLDQFARFGRGEPVGHWGGRYLWQLQAHDDLLVAWRLEDDPIRAERELLDEFALIVGKLPFANLTRGQRSALSH